jgi:predicted dehydrogenase
VSVSRVLVVGLGSIGKLHLRLARELLPHADIRVLRREEGAALTEHANGGFSRMDQAIAFRPQIAVIANPAPFHLSAAQSLADAGVHLMVEKPLSVAAEGVQGLIESCCSGGLVLVTGYNLRFLPSLQRFRDLLKQNVIGKVLSVRCEIGQYLPSWRVGVDYRNGVSARHDLGGGALLELSHELDYLRWIFGEINWVEACLSRQSRLEIDVEDTVHLILGFAPESDGHQLIGTLSMDLVRHDTTRLCTSIGELGSLRWDGLTGTVELFEAGAKNWRDLFCSQHQREDSYRAQWGNFLACVEGKSKPFVSGEDGFKVMQVIDAARHASVTGGRLVLKDYAAIDRKA